MLKPEDLNGDPPNLEGMILQELLVEAYWSDRRLVEEACVIHLKANGAWHRLYFEDDGIVFWRPGEGMPEAVEFVTDEGAFLQYLITDLGRRLQVAGDRIHSYEMESIKGGSRVRFLMMGGVTFAFECLGDVSRIVS